MLQYRLQPGDAQRRLKAPLNGCGAACFSPACESNGTDKPKPRLAERDGYIVVVSLRETVCRH